MTGQLSLDGFPGEQPPPDRLFLGIFPDAAAITRIARTARELRARHALTGKLLAPDRFHVTLFHLGDTFGLPEALVRSALEAAGTITAPPFEVSFDFAESFAKRTHSLPLVLRTSTGADRLLQFQRGLGDALKKVGLGRFVRPQFTPHVTLFYDTKAVPREPVEPVGWTVREFVLVHSLFGQTRYIRLGCWPLRG